ncbi:hypothetical protein ISN44_As07g008160 [Arabidopsis suecica]|uniref:Uncharacterized protein n=1 Tax=Arabidopsis suecica TaxID=45249 RepID=A0A8T2BR53_ARASU|nr:hypothetical protein ISN44_As07g008160 [Arabidopsis suecica]
MVLTDSSDQYLSSRVMSIHLNRNVFPEISGGFSHWRHLRFSTDEFSPNLWFREVIWVFDPRIYRQIFSIGGIGLCDDGDVLALSRSNDSRTMENEIMVTNRQR